MENSTVAFGMVDRYFSAAAYCVIIVVCWAAFFIERCRTLALLYLETTACLTILTGKKNRARVKKG